MDPWTRTTYVDGLLRPGGQQSRPLVPVAGPALDQAAAPGLLPVGLLLLMLVRKVREHSFLFVCYCS